MQLRLVILVLLSLMIASTTAAPVPGFFGDIWRGLKRTGKEILGAILDHIANSVPSAAAPYHTTCPAEPLIRLADIGRMSPLEAEYVKARKAAADPALQQWLQSTGLNFSLGHDQLPMLAMTTSGGGLRSLLTGAGIHQAMDIREKDVTGSGLSGLLQAMTYEAGTSGGGWLLGSLGTNDWPTVSSISDHLWIKNLQGGHMSMADGRDHDITGIAMDFMDVMHKHAAGFKVSFSDASGEILATGLTPEDNGVYTWSGLTGIPAYTNHLAPFPITTALTVDVLGICPDARAAFRTTQYEMTPYEFGSWDPSVSAFMSTTFLGTSMRNGMASQCVQNFDSIAFILGTTSNVWNVGCALEHKMLPAKIFNFFQTLLGDDDNHLSQYARVPSPWYQHDGVPAGAREKSELYLVDGGETDEHNPIHPFLHRPDVDVIFVSDNSNGNHLIDLGKKGVQHYPTGWALISTYLTAQAANLTRMPFIPDNATFSAQGFNKRPVFFGCNEPNAMTIVYLPNMKYTFDSGVATERRKYSPDETRGMIRNGVQIATKGGDEKWPKCVACAVMSKSVKVLPEECGECLREYCWNEGDENGKAKGGS